MYPDRVAKASAILESIIISHPWLDGNKRTGYMLMELVLWEGGLEVAASEDEKYDLVVLVATGQLDAEGVRAWLETRVKPVRA